MQEAEPCLPVVLLSTCSFVGTCGDTDGAPAVPTSIASSSLILRVAC